MNERYVMANIKMPIKINADRTTEPLAEYISFELEQCDKPSANLKSRNVQSEFIQSINRLFNQPDETESTIDPPQNIEMNETESTIEPPQNMEKELSFALTITKEEIKRPPKKSAGHNTTFKNLHHNARTRHTVKNYSNS